MVKLSEGNGGKEMDSLISRFTEGFPRGNWTHWDDDAAILKTDIGFFGFTSDSFVVDPPFFPGGNIGDLAFCGTVNDLAVMGIKPSALSVSLVIEEGFPDDDLAVISRTLRERSEETGIPIVTGDTKVMQKGKVDRIIINTSAIGITDKVLDVPVQPGDLIILSGSLGDHAVAVLSERFDFETSVVTDSMPLWDLISSVKPFIKQAKDPTRGGLAAVLNEFSSRSGFQVLVHESRIPVKPEVRSAVDLLGVDLYSLACEGRFVCVVEQSDADFVLETLRKFDPSASIIGEFTEKSVSEVVVKTRFGLRLLPKPSGNLVPRIC